MPMPVLKPAALPSPPASERPPAPAEQIAVVPLPAAPANPVVPLASEPISLLPPPDKPADAPPAKQPGPGSGGLY